MTSMLPTTWWHYPRSGEPGRALLAGAAALAPAGGLAVAGVRDLHGGGRRAAPPAATRAAGFHARGNDIGVRGDRGHLRQPRAGGCGGALAGAKAGGPPRGGGRRCAWRGADQVRLEVVQDRVATTLLAAGLVGVLAAGLGSRELVVADTRAT